MSISVLVWLCRLLPFCLLFCLVPVLYAVLSPLLSGSGVARLVHFLSFGFGVVSCVIFSFVWFGVIRCDIFSIGWSQCLPLCLFPHVVSPIVTRCVCLLCFCGSGVGCCAVSSFVWFNIVSPAVSVSFCLVLVLSITPLPLFVWFLFPCLPGSCVGCRVCLLFCPVLVLSIVMSPLLSGFGVTCCVCLHLFDSDVVRRTVLCCV